MSDLAKLIKELRKLSESDLQRVLDAIEAGPERSDSSFELVGMSDLEEGVEEKTRVFIMDKKMKRGIRSGEEGKQDEIAAEEGEPDSDQDSVLKD